MPWFLSSQWVVDKTESTQITVNQCFEVFISLLFFVVEKFAVDLCNQLLRLCCLKEFLAWTFNKNFLSFILLMNLNQEQDIRIISFFSYPQALSSRVLSLSSFWPLVTSRILNRL